MIPVDASTAAVSGETEAVANGNVTAEQANDEKPAEEQKPSAANEDEEDEDGPSPNKRPKTDEDSEKVESEKDKKSQTQNEEDEYEDVVPEPRETAALLDGYVLIGLVPTEQLRPGPQRAGSRKECEVILLVGLPGAGKTHWTFKHLAENVDKRYEVIGPDAFIAKMTVRSIAGRWNYYLKPYIIVAD